MEIAFLGIEGQGRFFGFHVFTPQCLPASLPSYSYSYGFGSPPCEVRSLLHPRQRKR